jgi:FAD/FMN-containing dehydrogenase
LLAWPAATVSAGLTSPAALLAAAGMAIACPALIALVMTGADVVRPVTPRMRIVLGVGSPWPSAADRLGRSVLPGAAALGIAAAVAGYAGFTALALAGVVVGAGAATGVLVRCVSADRAAEAAARVLLALTGGAVLGVAVVPAAPGPVTATAVLILLGALAAVAAVRAARSGGRELRPGTLGYRRAVRGFERSARLRPEVAVVAATVADVRTAILRSAEAGRGVVANSTGHAAVSLPDLTGATLIRVRIDEPVTVDARRRTVRVPAGTRWGDVLPAIAPTGLMAPHGSSPLVGAVGYLLRGGLSFYGRTSGVAANALESIELVTADGLHQVVDRERDPELFWALRGGGGGFGVVTAVTVRLFPIAALTTGTAFWPAEHAPALLEAWSAWHRTAPREAATTFRIMRLPGVPGIPRAIAGRPMVSVDGVVHARQGSDPRRRVNEVTDGLLGPLRRIADPVLDTWRLGSVLDVPWTHMDPALALSTVADHQLLTHLDRAGQQAFLDAALISESPLATVELRQLGGAFDDAPDDGGALAHLAGATSLFATGLITRGNPLARLDDVLGQLRSAMDPWGTGYTAPNYAEDRRRPQRTFPAETARRVQAVRERVDPTGLFALDVALGAVPQCDQSSR